MPYCVRNHCEECRETERERERESTRALPFVITYSLQHEGLRLGEPSLKPVHHESPLSRAICTIIQVLYLALDAQLLWKLSQLVQKMQLKSSVERMAEHK
jgi:hypothetical protein